MISIIAERSYCKSTCYQGYTIHGNNWVHLIYLPHPHITTHNITTHNTSHHTLTSHPHFKHHTSHPHFTHRTCNITSQLLYSSRTSSSHTTPSHTTPSHTTPSHTTPSHTTPSHITPHNTFQESSSSHPRLHSVWSLMLEAVRAKKRLAPFWKTVVDGSHGSTIHLSDIIAFNPF